MNAEHARPMMAYIALCLVASYVLSQGVFGGGPSLGPIDIARAGRPVLLVTDAVTLSAAADLLESGVGAVPAPLLGVVVSAGTGRPARRVTHAVEATAPRPATQHVAPAVTLVPTSKAAQHGGTTTGRTKAASRNGSRAGAQRRPTAKAAASAQAARTGADQQAAHRKG
jgi:hypothetical protein